MKRPFLILIALLVVISPSFSQAQSLNDLMSISRPICKGEGNVALVEQGLRLINVDISQIKDTICQADTILQRVNKIVESTDGSFQGFINTAFTDGYALLQEYTDVNIDAELLKTIQGTINDITAIQSGELNGMTASQLLNFITNSALAKRVESVIGNSRNSMQAFIDIDAQNLTSETPQQDFRTRYQDVMNDPSIINPQLAMDEIESASQVVALNSQVSSSVSVASESRALATAALSRGDEATIMTTATNPIPTDYGNAERAVQNANRAVSTRAVMQALVEAQADSARLNALSSSSLLTAIKETNLQQSYTVQQLSTIANALYQEQIEQSEIDYDAHRQVLEEGIKRARSAANSMYVFSQIMKDFSDELQKPLP